MPPRLLVRCSTRPLTGATVGVPCAAIMSVPLWVRPPDRAAPQLSVKCTDPCTGHFQIPSRALRRSSAAIASRAASWAAAASAASNRGPSSARSRSSSSARAGSVARRVSRSAGSSSIRSLSAFTNCTCWLTADSRSTSAASASAWAALASATASSCVARCAFRSARSSSSSARSAAQASFCMLRTASRSDISATVSAVRTSKAVIDGGLMKASIVTSSICAVSPSIWRSVSVTAASRSASLLTAWATAASADSSWASCCSMLASSRSSAAPAVPAPPVNWLVSAPTRVRLAASTGPLSSSGGSSCAGPALAADGSETRPATTPAIRQRRSGRQGFSLSPAPMLERHGNKWQPYAASVVGAGGRRQRIGVDRLATARVVLEVEVGRAGRRVAAAADVADDRARGHPAGALVGIAGKVGAVVGVAVVAVDVPAQAAEAGAPVLDPPADGRHGGRAGGGHHVDALVDPSPRAGGAPRVGEVDRPLHRAHDAAAGGERTGRGGAALVRCGGLRLGLAALGFLSLGLGQPGERIGVLLGLPHLVELGGQLVVAGGQQRRQGRIAGGQPGRLRRLGVEPPGQRENELVLPTHGVLEVGERSLRFGPGRLRIPAGPFLRRLLLLELAAGAVELGQHVGAGVGLDVQHPVPDGGLDGVGGGEHVEGILRGRVDEGVDHDLVAARGQFLDAPV